MSKLGIEHVALLHATGMPGPISGQRRFVLVERADKLGQAVSLAIAEGASWWASYNEPVRLASDLVFSRRAIDACFDLFLDQGASFDRFCAENGVVPTTVNYEQFVQRLSGDVTSYVGDALGLRSLRSMPANVRVRRQWSETNHFWRDLYLAGTE